MEDALKALEITLTPEDLKRIDEIIPPGTHVSLFYYAEHGASQFRWRLRPVSFLAFAT